MLKSKPGKLLLAATAIIAGFSGSTLHAALISQAQNFNFDTTLATGSGANDSLLNFDSFDPSMGQLTSVELSFNAVLEIDGNLPTSVIFGSGGIEPNPYPYQIDFDLAIGGLNFANDASFDYSGTSPGFPAFLLLADATNTIGYSSVLTAATDTAGTAAITDTTVTAPFLLPQVPGSANYTSPDQITNSLSDFISTTPGASTPIALTPALSFLAVLPSGLTGIANLEGEFTVDYSYEDISLIPLPSAFWLFGTAFFGFFAFKQTAGFKPNKARHA